MTEFLRSYLVPAGTGLADDPGLKASRWSTGGALSVFETTIAEGPPLHVHDREDECFYVLDGELSVRCAQEAYSAGAGSFVFLPRGRPHRFWASAGPARLLLIAAPAGIEDYFREIGNASTADEQHQVGERFGIRVVTGPADEPDSASPDLFRQAGHTDARGTGHRSPVSSITQGMQPTSSIGSG